MGFFYFDESIHPRGRFALGAFVYSEDALDDAVGNALRRAGLVPGKDEFKSSAPMAQDARQNHARGRLRRVVYRHCRIGLVIAPHEPRSRLGSEALLGLHKIVTTNEFSTASHDVYFDQGVFTSGAAAKALQQTGLTDCGFHVEQDSARILGLQVADLVAHTAATMLLAEMGFVKKMVNAGEKSGLDPDLNTELEFELWASLRYSFFSTIPPDSDKWASYLDWVVDVASRGLHISEICEDQVKKAALATFGRMYQGCIH